MIFYPIKKSSWRVAQNKFFQKIYIAGLIPGLKLLAFLIGTISVWFALAIYSQPKGFEFPELGGYEYAE